MNYRRISRVECSARRLCRCFVFITWIFASNLTSFVIGCPPPDLLLPCKCEGVATINCDNITSSQQLAESLVQEFGKVGVFDKILINHTPINSIPSHLFTSVKAKTFRITNNPNLNYVGDNAFAGSEDTAESVMLNNNNISENTVFEAISKLKHLKDLNLERNQFIKIPENAFVNAKELKTVVLSLNVIISIGKGAFSNLTHLEMIDLRHNKITTIGEYCFYNLPQLKEINLSENRLEVAGDYSFALGPSSILDSETTEIWLNDNELTEFWPKAFEGLGRSALIHLFQNRLMAFPERFFISILDLFHSLNSNLFFSKGFLDLDTNAIICDCKVKWLVEKPKYLRYALGIVCIDTGRSLSSYDKSDFKDCNYT